MGTDLGQKSDMMVEYELLNYMVNTCQLGLQVINLPFVSVRLGFLEGPHTFLSFVRQEPQKGLSTAWFWLLRSVRCGAFFLVTPHGSGGLHTARQPFLYLPSLGAERQRGRTSGTSKLSGYWNDQWKWMAPAVWYSERSELGTIHATMDLSGRILSLTRSKVSDGLQDT